MDFELSEEQRLLVETAASFAKSESPISRMRALREDELGFERRTWKQMGELGWLGILFPESVGGFGGRFIDAALVMEQFGKTLVPEPYVASMVLAGMSVLKAGTPEQQKAILPGAIAGEQLLALAHEEVQSRYNVCDVATTAREVAGGFVLSGHKRFVLAGHGADTFVVSARVSGDQADRTGLSLFVVPRGAAGLAIAPVKTMDGRRAANLELRDVTVPSSACLGAPGHAADTLEAVLDLAAAAACAEASGIAQAVLAMTVEYLKTRQQFGVPIGSFQALQHRAVDMFIEVELCRSMAILAGIRADDPDPGDRQAAVSAAKAQLSVGGRYVVRQGIQLHGGIGCTDEHDVGLYFKRMQTLSALFGDEQYHVERYASLPAFVANIGEIGEAPA